jgi:hypothetical protein
VNKLIAAFCLLTLVAAPAAFAADDADITGAWEVVTTYNGGLPSTAGLEITRDGDKYSGKSGWLVPAFSVFEYTGTREKDAVRLTVSSPGGGKFGELVLRVRRGALEGSGELFGVPVKLSGQRPRVRPANAPRVHEFTPTVFYRVISVRSRRRCGFSPVTPYARRLSMPAVATRAANLSRCPATR